MSRADDLINAIHLIQKHLRDDWISEGCKGERVIGCASCAMIRLHEDLDMLVYEIEGEELWAKSRETSTPTTT